MSKLIFDFVVITAVFLFAVTLVVEGVIPPWLAVTGLFAAIGLRIFGRIASGGDRTWRRITGTRQPGPGGVTRMLFSIALPVLSLAILLVSLRSSGIEPAKKPQLVGFLALCFVLLLSFYFIVIRPSNESGYWSLPIVASIMIFVVSLLVGGYISFGFAVFSCVALILIYSIGKVLGGGAERNVRSTFKITLPLAGLIVFLFIFLPRKGVPTSNVLSLVVTLLVLIFAFMLIVGGFKGQ